MRAPATAWICGLSMTILQAAPSPACTSFCMDTPDGPIYGTNMDLFLGEGLVFVNPRGIAKEGLGTNTAGEKAKWISKHGSVTFNLAGREFAWGGMNEAGLTMSTMALMASQLPEPDERIPFDSGSLIQYVLDNCGTVEEAIQTISRVRLVDDGDSRAHFLMADAAGSCAGIEYVGGKLMCYTGDDLPVRAMANATYKASLDFVERGVRPQFNPGASVERVATAAGMAQRFRPDLGIPAVDYALGILTESVVAPKKWWSNWFDEPYTRWSIAFDIARREVHFRTVENPRVRHLALGSFDLSCTAPLRMLDVNAKLDGNVKEAFIPFDHDINLGVFRSFCDRWGIDVPKEDAVDLMRFFETFQCAKLES